MPDLGVVSKYWYLHVTISWLELRGISKWLGNDGVLSVEGCGKAIDLREPQLPGTFSTLLESRRAGHPSCPHPSLPTPWSQLGCSYSCCGVGHGSGGVQEGFFGRSWNGKAVFPPGKDLECLEGGPGCCRCCIGRAGVGLLDAVELFLFIKKWVLHTVLPESLSSSFQEKLANPPHAMSFCQELSPQSSHIVSWILVFSGRRETRLPFYPVSITQRILQRKAGLLKVIWSVLTQKDQWSLTGTSWGSSHAESPKFLLSCSISGAGDTRRSSRLLPHTTLEVQCFDIIFLIWWLSL